MGSASRMKSSVVDGMVRLAGWYMSMTPDLTFYTILSPSRQRLASSRSLASPAAERRSTIWRTP